MSSCRGLVALLVTSSVLMGCGRSALVSSDALPLRRVVLYRNGVAYFERGGRVDESEVRFKMKEGAVGDFLATLAVIERGGSSVRAAAFPLKIDDENEEAKPRRKMSDDEKKGMKTVVLTLDGKEHDLSIGYVAESPVWRPSYRLVVHAKGEADLQAWGIVQNLSGEDWKDVKLALVAGAPLAFESQLGVPVIPARPVVTDNGEVIAAMPKSETSLRQQDTSTERGRLAAKDTDRDGISDADDKCPTEPETYNGYQDEDGCPDRGRVVVSESKPPSTEAEESYKKRDRSDAPKAPAPRAAARAVSGSAASAGKPMVSRRGPEGDADESDDRDLPMQAPAAPPPPPASISAPRNLRSLAAVAVEGGTTRYDLPSTVNVPDKSATMVMLLARRVKGEASFLFAPDGGVPDSSSHPFRVARFTNGTNGVLERGPIAVFEEGSFLGQGMVDPLPAGASATVPFALERGVAVDRDIKHDELGARLAKIENAQLTIERDSVTQTKYRMRNGLDQQAKVLVKHGRIGGAKLHAPPPETEDNVGAGTALVPSRVAPHATAELVVDERVVVRRGEDWFSAVADEAVKGFLADPAADAAVKAKLQTLWTVRNEIVARSEARSKIDQEQSNIGQQTEETRRNLRAIEKNKSADALRAKLTQRLGEMATRLDELTKKVVEIDSKLAELRVQFKEGLRDVKYVRPAS